MILTGINAAGQLPVGAGQTGTMGFISVLLDMGLESVPAQFER